MIRYTERKRLRERDRERMCVLYKNVHIRGAIIQGQGTCGMFQSFLIISADVLCTYFVHRDTLCELTEVFN